MSGVTLDHVIVICDPGAPAADALRELGIVEGSRNVHPGQGTENRRFFFHNAYLELVWVSDLAESRSEPAFRTRLWERWLRRHEGACPFGIALRPLQAHDESAKPPFPTWSYYAPYLPQQVAIAMAINTPLTEPEFFYLNFATGPKEKNREPIDHPLGLREITAVRIGLPGGSPQSAASKAARTAGIVSFYNTAEYQVELEFDGGAKKQRTDLNPGLPLILSW